MPTPDATESDSERLPLSQRRLSPRALFGVALLGFAAATPWFASAVFLVHRGVGTDSEGAIACGLIGLLLGLPSLAVWTVARHPGERDPLRTQFPSLVLRLAALLVGLPVLACSSAASWDLGCRLLHREPPPFLNFRFPGDLHETALVAGLCHATGMFLVWFAYHRRGSDAP